MSNEKLEPRDHPLARKLYSIIFEADTRPGLLFDLALLVAIIVSVVAIALETVEPFREQHQNLLDSIEWTCTILFTIEYLLRVWCVRRPSAYIFSFFGIVDLLSVAPGYVTLFGGRGESFAVIRSLRLLRVFRILELGWLESEANSLMAAVWEARAKVVVFFVTVLIIVTIAGTAMYEIEHDPRPDAVNDQFDSIPQSVYWAIITMTTVGYGDVVPHSTAGKFVAALLVLLGYSLIIVPTGFVSAELGVKKSRATPKPPPADRPDRGCHNCGATGHPDDAKFCNQCGAKL